MAQKTKIDLELEIEDDKEDNVLSTYSTHNKVDVLNEKRDELRVNLLESDTLTENFVDNKTYEENAEKIEIEIFNAIKTNNIKKLSELFLSYKTSKNGLINSKIKGIDLVSLSLLFNNFETTNFIIKNGFNLFMSDAVHNNLIPFFEILKINNEESLVKIFKDFNFSNIKDVSSKKTLSFYNLLGCKTTFRPIGATEDEACRFSPYSDYSFIDKFLVSINFILREGLPLGIKNKEEQQNLFLELVYGAKNLKDLSIIENIFKNYGFLTNKTWTDKKRGRGIIVKKNKLWIKYIKDDFIDGIKYLARLGIFPNKTTNQSIHSESKSNENNSSINSGISFLGISATSFAENSFNLLVKSNSIVEDEKILLQKNGYLKNLIGLIDLNNITLTDKSQKSLNKINILKKYIEMFKLTEYEDDNKNNILHFIAKNNKTNADIVVSFFKEYSALTDKINKYKKTPLESIKNQNMKITIQKAILENKIKSNMNNKKTSKFI